MAVISFDAEAERIWNGAGWAFRQILRDLSSYAQGDIEFQGALERAGHLGSFIVELLDPRLKDRVTLAVMTMCTEIRNGTRPSSIAQHHSDRETQDLYWQELERLGSAAKSFIDSKG